MGLNINVNILILNKLFVPSTATAV